MSTTEDTTNASSLHALREEIRKARDGRRPVTVNVEDAIFARLVEAEALLAVAAGLFTELSEDKANWLWRHRDGIMGARWTLRRVVDDGKCIDNRGGGKCGRV